MLVGVAWSSRLRQSKDEVNIPISKYYHGYLRVYIERQDNPGGCSTVDNVISTAGSELQCRSLGNIANVNGSSVYILLEILPLIIGRNYVGWGTAASCLLMAPVMTEAPHAIT